MTRKSYHPVSLLLVGFLAFVAVSRPWVVVPLDGKNAVTGDPASSAAERIAATVWDEQIPVRVANALPLGDLDSTPRFVSGEGVVKSIDLSSRVGIARIQASAGEQQVELEMAIGPVIRGNVLRDALGLKFADFDSQVDFANMSSRLNGLVLSKLELLSTPHLMEGRTIRFVGAASRVPEGKIGLVPVQLMVVP